MLSRTVVSKRIVSWVTIEICRRSEASVTSRTSTPSKVIASGGRVVEPGQQVDECRLAGAGRARPGPRSRRAGPQGRHPRGRARPRIGRRRRKGSAVPQKGAAPGLPAFSAISFLPSISSKRRTAEERASWRAMFVRVTSFNGLYIIITAARNEMSPPTVIAPGGDLAGRVDEHGGKADAGQDLHQGGIQGLQAHRPPADPEVAVVGSLEARGLEVLHPVGLDDAVAAQRLREDRAHLADPLARRCRRPAEPPRVVHDRKKNDGSDDEHGQREPRVEREDVTRSRKRSTGCPAGNR